MDVQHTGEHDTPLERIGGSAGVSAVVDDLYRRAELDAELSAYFHRTDMVTQRRRLADIITAALGGRPTSWLVGLQEAHRGRGITHRHFSLMAAHLIDTLDERGVRPDETEVLMAWFAAGRDAVVDTAVPRST
jgi:hemoglobin